MAAAVNDMPALSLGRLFDLDTLGFFQAFAWYAAFRLMAASNPAPVAQLSDILILLALCALLLFPTTWIIWADLLFVAILGWGRGRGDQKLRAASIVLAALSFQQFWGRVVFGLFTLPLLRAETAVVGTILQALRTGTVWSDNVITGPSGHGIVVYTACSAFHNLSLAMLCWLAVSQLKSQDWNIRDLLTGWTVGVITIVCNVVRLCLMAWNPNLYDYWHSGEGAEIFSTGVSVVILFLSLYGSRTLTRAR